MSIRVYLDDLRACPAGFTLVRTVDECVTLLNELEVEVLSLDFNLFATEQSTDKTGFSVVSHIVQSGRWPAEIYLHTSDPVGRDKMYHILQQHAPEGVRIYKHKYGL